MSWRVVALAARAVSVGALLVGAVLLFQDVGGRWASLCVMVILVFGWLSAYATRRNTTPHLSKSLDAGDV